MNTEFYQGEIMKINKLILSGLLFVLAPTSNNAWTTSPKLISDKDIAALKSDFNMLISGHKTIQELKVAQNIIELVKTDAAQQKTVQAWQKELSKVQVSTLTSLNDHPQEIQSAIQDVLNKAKSNMEFVYNKIKTELASGVHKLTMQQTLDAIMNSVNCLQEKISSQEQQRIALETRTQQVETVLAQKDTLIQELQNELAAFRSTLESSSVYYQTKIDTSMAVLQKTKQELATTQARAMKTEEFAKALKQSTQKLEHSVKGIQVALQDTVEQKDQHIKTLQVQLEGLGTQVSILSKDMQDQKGLFDDKKIVISDWPAVQSLLKLDKK